MIPTQALQAAREALVARIITDVCELPDRTSPEDQPDMMLVTGNELSAIINNALDSALSSPEPATTARDEVAKSMIRYRERLNVAGEYLCTRIGDDAGRKAYAAVLYVQSALKLDAEALDAHRSARQATTTQREYLTCDRDIIVEAVNAYNEYMGDDYDAVGTLHKIMCRMIERASLDETLTAAISARQAIPSIEQDIERMIPGVEVALTQHRLFPDLEPRSQTEILRNFAASILAVKGGAIPSGLAEESDANG